MCSTHIEEFLDRSRGIATSTIRKPDKSCVGLGASYVAVKIQSSCG
jgi:hypothetical protein